MQRAASQRRGSSHSYQVILYSGWSVLLILASHWSDVLPEDKELRKQLQMDRLELVLRVQEEERR